MYTKLFLIKLLWLIFISFITSNTLVAQVLNQGKILKNKKLSNDDFKDWFHKDIEKDTIPGISLERAYKELLKNREGLEVVVAVIDTKLDIHHEDIKDQIWVNIDEIPDNNIDDDKNGYIDDVNGWDFLSNTKGEFIKYANLECMRVIRKFDTIFADRAGDAISETQKANFAIYQRAKKEYLQRKDNAEDYIKSADNWLNDYYPNAKKALEKFFPDGDYNISQLDSLLIIKTDDSIQNHHIKVIRTALKYDLTPELYTKWRNITQNELSTMLNIEFNERKIMGDNPEDILDNSYGHNQVYGDVPFQHAISVSGVLAATRSTNLGIMGISDNIKIMPVVMVASGDEHDKDIALAIRYAVDNGAQIINMSWGKNFSTHEDWVQDAIKYAADKDVLLVKVAGNGSRSIDANKYYPRDYLNNKEIVNNFIVVGASSYFLDKRLIASFSNYGKKNVDIFAPGYKVYTTEINNEYAYSSGTSIASPIVSGVAALLRSYYPNLSAVEVKNIILASGVSYEIDVRISKEGDSEELVPFSELSKSGKIVNAYNALIMADNISKKKNKK